MAIGRGLLLSLLVLSLLTSQAFAAAPIDEFVFQGFLKDKTGKPFTGQKHVTLRIYTTSTGGSPPANTAGVTCPNSNLGGCIWQENQTNIGFVNGIFTINAGNQTKFAGKVDFSRALFLEIIIKNTTNNGSEEILRPRINLTASPFSLSTERGNFGYFNGTQLLINQTGTTSTKAVMNVTNLGLGPSLIIKSGAATKNVVNITAGGLTTGSGLVIGSSSGGFSGSLLNLTDTSTGVGSSTAIAVKSFGSYILNAYNNQGTYFFIDTDGAVVIGPGASVSGELTISDPASANTAIAVKTGATANNMVNITAGSLTTGSALNIGSTSGSTSARNLVNIVNDNSAATGTTALRIQQDADQNALTINSATATRHILNVTGGSLTTGSALNIASSSGSTATRNLVNLTNTNTAATGTTVLNIRQNADDVALKVVSSTSTDKTMGAVNITAGSLTTGSALVIGSSSGSSATRSILNITNNNAAATGAVPISIWHQPFGPHTMQVYDTSGIYFAIDDTGFIGIGDSASDPRAGLDIDLSDHGIFIQQNAPSTTLINATNSTGAQVFMVPNSGVVTVTQLKVNTTGTALTGIFIGTNTAPVEGLNRVLVLGADSNDLASCTFQNVGQNDQGATITFIGNITNVGHGGGFGTVFANATSLTAGGLDVTDMINCLVFRR